MMKKKKLVITAKAENRLYWHDLWCYRELFYFLVWRDILVRYKQTTIGVIWALLKPLMIMIVLTIVFGVLAQLPTQGVPYPIFVFSAMLPWQFFASAIVDCSNSLLNDSNLITKVYFPRLIVPVSAVIVSFIDFLISGILLLGLMAWYNFVPDWQILLLPVFVAIAFAFAVGGGLWFAALNVKYRDFRYIVPLIVQLGLYISPVGFSSTIIPEQWKLLYFLNPMVGVIDGFRWATLGGEYPMYWQGLGLSLLLVIAILGTGIRYFLSIERKFADVI